MSASLAFFYFAFALLLFGVGGMIMILTRYEKESRDELITFFTRANFEDIMRFQLYGKIATWGAVFLIMSLFFFSL